MTHPTGQPPQRDLIGYGETPPHPRLAEQRPTLHALSLSHDVEGLDRPFSPCHSVMTLTWAATTCQPCGMRTQVCIWRPTFPGKTSR
jgi:hypothetical protein